MNLTAAQEKWREAATASPIKGGYYRSDNFAALAFRFRHKPYADAEISEVAHSIISVKYAVENGAEIVTKEEFYYVQ